MIALNSIHQIVMMFLKLPEFQTNLMKMESKIITAHGLYSVTDIKFDLRICMTEHERIRHGPAAGLLRSWYTLAGHPKFSIHVFEGVPESPFSD